MPSILVVGEAAGPWGCRFSGVPFTGEEQLIRGVLPFVGGRSSNDKPLIDVEKPHPYTSNSAEIFWEVMETNYPKFLVWDCVPVHPHELGEPLSVRNPSPEEIEQFSHLLKEIYDVMKPTVVAAVGRIAESALHRIGLKAIYVRHPSHGGADKFRAGMEAVFDRPSKITKGAREGSADEAENIRNGFVNWRVKAGFKLPRMYRRYKLSGDSIAALLVQTNLIEFHLKQLLFSLDLLISMSTRGSDQGTSSSSHSNS